MTEPQSRPDRFCDMVMKGGITSGVVYPLAIGRLSEEFVFKNIGGTSAGAIAAAATAGAELARDTDGFDRLRRLPEFLSAEAPDGSRSNLFAFFQPQPQTARLFRLAVAGLGGGLKAIAAVGKRMLLEFFPAILLGALPATFFLVLTVIYASGPFRIVCVVVGLLLLLGGVLVCILANFFFIVTHALPRNFYGLCTGMTDDFADLDGNPPNRSKPLTFWLTEYLNEFVGRKSWEQPLTFGELWGTRDPNALRHVNLEMMTTCLTHGRPYRLPFRDDREIRENRFYFRSDEFRCLFPKNVVDWMLAHPREIAEPPGILRDERLEHRAILGKQGLYPLPDPADLPVVVAVRMSLSFPILLSAIPLHAIDRVRDPKGLKPERCWFSDGGVCSNFPLHFFDSPFPRWPTLSIDLIQKPPGTSAEEFLKPQMVKNNSAGIQENWNRFEFSDHVDPEMSREKSGLGKLSGFVGAFIITMQNWSDNTLSRLPGYRDRIRPVPLSSTEGGLNLNMPKERIDALTSRGIAAGDEFVARFSLPPSEPKMNWNNHRWIRMRSSLASLEMMLAQIDSACTAPQSGDVDFESWIAQTPPGVAPAYRWKEPQRDVALKMIKGLRQIVAECRKVGVGITDGSPRPRSELRRRAHA